MKLWTIHGEGFTDVETADSAEDVIATYNRRFDSGYGAAGKAVSAELIGLCPEPDLDEFPDDADYEPDEDYRDLPDDDSFDDFYSDDDESMYCPPMID